MEHTGRIRRECGRCGAHTYAVSCGSCGSFALRPVPKNAADERWEKVGAALASGPARRVFEDPA